MDTIEDGVPMSLGGTRPLPRVLSLLAAVAALTVACGGGGVRIAFRPQPGTRYEYVVTVHSTVKTQLGDQPAQNDDEETVLRATHTVLRSQRAGLVRVRVQLRTPGGTTRTFIVDLDRAAQLDAIETIEGLPAQVFGNLGVSEIFPAAAGAPPTRVLHAGDTWRIDDHLRLPDQGPARFVGAGRLVELAVVRGRAVARVRSATRLPVARRTELRQGQVVLRGSQATESTTTQDVSDGAVEDASSLSHGVFDVSLLPPPGSKAPPVDGRMVLDVRSTVRRVG